jgi:hypothetical protein
VLGLWAVLATVTAASAFGNTRYRTAAEVSIVLLATVSIDAIVRRLRREPPPPPDRPGSGLGRPTSAGSAVSIDLAEVP